MSAEGFVLAAGFGTRLRPLTEAVPKPLVPVCGVPLLAWSLALCARHGIREVVVNAHHRADQLLPWQGEHEGVTVHVSVEAPEILGTGGGLKYVADRLADRFVVLNADVLHAVDLRALLASVRPGGGAMALRADPEHAPGYGIVAADATHTVVHLTTVARAEPVGEVRSDTHFTGIHALDRVALDRVPDGFACIVRTAYKGLVPERRVGALAYGGPWLDCGDPPAYLDANLAVLRGEVVGAVDPFARAGFAVTADGTLHGDPALVAGATVRGPVWVGPGARIARGATLDHAIVGAGATVGSGVEVVRSVVWEGVDVAASLAGSIAWDTGRIATT